MRDYLVVANQTLGGDDLIAELRRRIAEGPCRLHIVVPANVRDGWTRGEAEAHMIASERLAEAIERFSDLGADVDGQVGDERPLDAMRDALRRSPCDEIILSTLPRGVSRWLGMDLVSRAVRTFSIPVTHVEATDAG